MRKISSYLKSTVLSEDKKVRVRQFIDTTSLICSGVDDWFGEALHLLAGLDVSIGERDINGLYGIDMEATRGSSLNLEELEDDESIASQDIETLIDEESKNGLNTSACSGERVLLFGDKPVGLQDLGLNDIEDDSLPDLMPGTPSDVSEISIQDFEPTIAGDGQIGTISPPTPNSYTVNYSIFLCIFRANVC